MNGPVVDERMIRNGHKMAIYENWKTPDKKNIVFHVIAFDPIKIWTRLAFQNYRLNLYFVKYINIVGNKMTRNDRKMTNSKSCIFFN